uniref:4Fe-4S domain-containing protein n=1 Tax=Caldimicrobium thiodismutans TaxID=1653476 RepID=A0A832GPX9_9BACT
MKAKDFLEYLKDNLKETLRLEQAYCHKPKGCYLAKISLPANFLSILPYLRGKVSPLFYDPQSSLIFKWPYRGNFYKISLGKDYLQWGIVSSKEEAEEVFSALFTFLRDLCQNLEEIKPDYRPVKRPPPLEIYKYLPKTNCKECGELSCLAFAGKVAIGEAEISLCPHLTFENLELLTVLLEGGTP